MDEVDLVVDLNTMDDSGLPWTFVDEARQPEGLVPGAYLVVGSGSARAVARVVDIDDGIVHVLPLRGSVASNAHHLSTGRAAP